MSVLSQVAVNSGANSEATRGKRVRLSGWGRFPIEECRLIEADTHDDLTAIVSSGTGSVIGRGLGRSYGDASLNQDSRVVSFLRMHVVHSFDAETGVLDCDAGLSLESIIQQFLPLGYFPPVVPGTKFVTVGGAIASNIHGKNQHAGGNFASHVLDMQLLLPSGKVVTCSHTRNPEIFWATAGGMGLTGFILRARLQLRRVESAFLAVDQHRTRDLDETLNAFAEENGKYEYSVCWIDCVAGGASMGRSVLIRGNHMSAADLPRKIREPLHIPSRLRVNVPFNLPNFTLNPLSIQAFNQYIYMRGTPSTGRAVDIESFFFPLDSVGHWNRIYGRRGLAQYQVVFPLETGREGMVRLLETLSASKRASFLAVLKRFGAADAGLLSFPFEGYTLALDLPASEGIVSFLRGLDKLALEYGGRIYLAKDSVVLPSTLARMYPHLEQFQRIRQQLDPEGRLSSSLARRVGIV